MKTRINLIWLLCAFIVIATASVLYADDSEEIKREESVITTKTIKPQETSANSTQKAMEKKKMPPWGDKYPEADSVFRAARKSMKSERNAPEFIAKLEQTIAKYPDYPMKGFLLYYLGLNARTNGDFSKAVKAFEEALKAKPDIAYKTPIVSYLKTAKNRALLRMIYIICSVLLLMALIPSLIGLTQKNAAELPWRRIVTVYGVTLALWAAIAFLLPRLYGSLAIEPGLYPNPTLSNVSIGQIGDASLRALLGYGLFAILATLPIIIATTRIQKQTLKTIVSVIGVMVVIGSSMGLYSTRHIYTDSRYDSESNRLVFFIKSITNPDEIPDVMFPMYDEKRRAHFLKNREVKAGEKDLK